MVWWEVIGLVSFIFEGSLRTFTNNLSRVAFIQDLNLNGSLDILYKCSSTNLVLLFDTYHSINLTSTI